MGDAVIPAEVGPGTQPAGRGASSPIRTCLGCRGRDARSSLLRLVADATQPSPASVRVVVPDPGRSLPGRGAWIHPTQACLDQAVRRRAVGRALRLAVGVNLDEVRAYVETTQADAR